ncbi:MAG: UDP-N-acetylglucosamine 1-carboxyvinyltransferase, partial [Planctomycetes bacterium]|nr:UDP-N-acetylglucosamine 1-carboxyvinyltransferase [Planctomycetota bacterium]
MKNIFHIEGGIPLHGNIAASGNKNAALPLIALSIMLDGPLSLTNLPRIGDVNIMLTMLEEMGATVKFESKNAVTLNAAGISPPEIDSELSGQLRGSVLLAAPMLARFGKVEMPFPGGDRIGRRRLDTHLLALKAMGASIETTSEGYAVTCQGRLRGADILLDEASVTATENTVMAAALAEGQTTIYNAACEPHVQDLCRTLVAAGAVIDGIGTNRLVVNGVRSLGGAEIDISADMIEVGSLIVLAALTGGEVTITNTNPADLRMILLQLKRLGISVKITGNTIHVASNQT